MFEFGTNEAAHLEGKGVDWMLDPFLQKKVTGQAGFDYEIVQTLPEIVTEVLNEKYDHNQISRILQKYSFYTLFLAMNIKMNDPQGWALSWARFEYEMVGDNLAVLSFSPNLEGIKTTIERLGSRELNMSLSAELKPISVDTIVSPGISYDKKRGWTVKFDTMIEEVRGFKTRTMDGKINLQWDIYKNKAIQVPDDNMGVTAGVYGTALISSPRHSEPSINVKVSGETVRKGQSIRSRGIIELTSGGMFSIQPTL